MQKKIKCKLCKSVNVTKADRVAIVFGTPIYYCAECTKHAWLEAYGAFGEKVKM